MSCKDRSAKRAVRMLTDEGAVVVGGVVLVKSLLSHRSVVEVDV